MPFLTSYFMIVKLKRGGQEVIEVVGVNSQKPFSLKDLVYTTSPVREADVLPGTECKIVFLLKPTLQPNWIGVSVNGGEPFFVTPEQVSRKVPIIVVESTKPAATAGFEQVLSAHPAPAAPADNGGTADPAFA